MKRRIILCVIGTVAILLLCGCGASTHKSYGRFKTPEQPPAIFKPDKNVAISNIDGKNIFVTTRNWWLPVVTKTRAAVLPGEHTLHIKYAVAGWQSLGCELKVEAESGKTYRVKAKSYAMDAPEGRDGFLAVNKPRAVKVAVWVEDVATNQKVRPEGGCTEIKPE